MCVDMDLTKQNICLQCRRPGFDSWVRKIPWRREWQPTPVFLPGESHGERSLAGYSPRGRKTKPPPPWPFPASLVFPRLPFWQWRLGQQERRAACWDLIFTFLLLVILNSIVQSYSHSGHAFMQFSLLLLFFFFFKGCVGRYELTQLQLTQLQNFLVPLLSKFGQIVNKKFFPGRVVFCWK